MLKLAVFLATSGHSGVDRIMTNLIYALAARGLEVDLLQIRNHGPYLDKTPPNIRIVDMGVNHVNTSLMRVIRYLRRKRPAALLSDKDKVNRVALWARRIARVPTRVVVRTGTTVSEDLAARSFLQKESQRLSMRYFYPWADGIIVPSLGAARDLSRFAGLPLERISVVPSPVVGPELNELAKQPVKHPWFLFKDSPVILSVGELCARKDFATLIQAFAILRQQRGCRLMILGEGRQRAKLQALIKNLGLENDIRLPGFIKNPYPYMAQADLFVLSSRWEGFGNVLVEALAVGAPVVATDCPSGPREIVENGRYGRLVPVGDINALAQAMLATLASPLKASFLQQASEPFRVETSAQRYLEVLGVSP